MPFRRLFLGLACLGLLTLSAAAETLLVGNKGDDTVGFIDLSQGDAGALVMTRPTGPSPHEVAVDPSGSLAAVVAYGDNRREGRAIDLFRVQTGERLASVSLAPHSSPHGLVWLPDGRQLVVTSEGSDHVLVVDMIAEEIVQAIETGADGSHMVAVSADGTRAFTANIDDGSVSVFDLSQGERLARVQAGPGTEGIALTPNGSELWVSNREGDTVMVYDAQSIGRLATIETGRFPIRVAISPDGETVIVSNARDGTLSVIDRQDRTVIETVSLTPTKDTPSVPVTVLFHPDGERLFVSMTSPGEIAVLDTETWNQIGTIAAGRGADGLGYSALSLTPDP